MSHRPSLTRRVAVLDMQPIEPAIGGGRQRLLGLYHALGDRLRTVYVGSYDWPGERYRQLDHSPTLREITVPLSDDHFAAAEAEAREAGQTVIDVTFPRLGGLSTDYVETARREARRADAVIFSHPWVYPLLADDLDPERQLIVYDAQNVEGLLRAQLLSDRGRGDQLALEVVRTESELCHACHHVLACSHDDRLLFHEIYGVPVEKILVAANGTFTRTRPPIGPAGRARARAALGVEPAQALVVFLASAYGPNVEAARLIADRLAAHLPDVIFAVVGGVGDALEATAAARPPNLRVVGTVDNTGKDHWLAAADLAINPMLSGSGTNVKMFDYLAAGLPVISTPVGARGIEQGVWQPAYEVRSPDGFSAAVRSLLADEDRRSQLAENGRRLVTACYSWETISPELGRWLEREIRLRRARRPFFTVVVPSYERPALLSRLARRLDHQSYRDFEVIVVDQSRDPWPQRNRPRGYDLVYLHSDVAGATLARNRALFHARGQVVAFTDDDCLPRKDWLELAAAVFASRSVIGIEGAVESARATDPEYRSVTTGGLCGVGFMTANLFLKIGVLRRIDGFDPRFDRPHFREDTDLGWRASEHGEIAFRPEVRVYHPPHRRSEERESAAARVRFFEKDPLLLHKHPVRYRELFLLEAHWAQTEGFWSNVFRGAEKYGVELPGWMMRYFTRYAMAREAQG